MYLFIHSVGFPRGLSNISLKSLLREARIQIEWSCKQSRALMKCTQHTFENSPTYADYINYHLLNWQSGRSEALLFLKSLLKISHPFSDWYLGSGLIHCSCRWVFNHSKTHTSCNHPFCVLSPSLKAVLNQPTLGNRDLPDKLYPQRTACNTQKFVTLSIFSLGKTQRCSRSLPSVSHLQVSQIIEPKGRLER